MLAKVVLSRYFLSNCWMLLKQLFLSPSWPLSQQPMRPKAKWAIDSEPIRARGMDVNIQTGFIFLPATGEPGLEVPLYKFKTARATATKITLT